MRALTLILYVSLLFPLQLNAEDPRETVLQAIEYMRGTTSVGKATMTVHRPDWERSMSLQSWMKGREQTLVRFTAPAKDAGNGSLTVHDEMWSFSPKVNKIIKIPPSMMNQSWMGSDFSYNDLSRADDIVDQYNHKLIGEESHDGKKVLVIESVPHDSAPVVWGKEILKIREDHLIIEHTFFDQDLKLVKKLMAKQIEVMDGRLFASVIRMENVEKTDEWTEVKQESIRFGKELPDSLFTQANLRNPRESDLP